MKAVLEQADAMITGGLSPDSLVAALVDHLRNLLILRTCGADSDLVEVPGLSMEELAAAGRAVRPGRADAGHRDPRRAPPADAQ